MPPFRDIRSFLIGNAFGRPAIPQGNLAGRTIIITGANTGLGFEAAMHLMRMRVGHLVLACRNAGKGESAAQKIRQHDANVGQSTKCSVWHVDLDSFDSVKSFCTRVGRELPDLDGIICNAGIELDKYETSEGFERTLTINVVSTFLIADRMLPILRESSRRRKVDTHLTVVGSCIHVFAPDEQLNINKRNSILETLSRKNTVDMKSRYNLSKSMVHQCFNEMAQSVTVTNRNADASHHESGESRMVLDGTI